MYPNEPEDPPADYYGNCHCCGQFLESYECHELDCGHIACNSCVYQEDDRMECVQCKENRECSTK